MFFSWCLSADVMQGKGPVVLFLWVVALVPPYVTVHVPVSTPEVVIGGVVVIAEFTCWKLSLINAAPQSVCYPDT